MIDSFDDILPLQDSLCKIASTHLKGSHMQKQDHSSFSREVGELFRSLGIEDTEERKPFRQLARLYEPVGTDPDPRRPQDTRNNTTPLEQYAKLEPNPK